MRLAILGGTGATGRLTIVQALRDGHEVTALARRPDALPGPSSLLRVVAGELADPEAMAATVRDADAVVSALGNRNGRHPTTVYSDGLAAVLAAGARRIVAVSAVPAAPDQDKTVLERKVVHPLLHLFFGGSYDDMRRMESLLARSDADWTVVRPPRLTNGPGTGTYRASSGRLRKASKISRADLAVALLDAARDASLTRHFLTVAR